MTDIRLVVIDLDGTLLNSAKQIPSDAIVAISRLRALGIPVILATGRTLRSAAPYARVLCLDTPIIAHAGAYVATLQNEAPWREIRIDCKVAAQLLHCLEQRDYYIKVYVGDHLFVQQATQETVQFSEQYHVPYTAVGIKNLSIAKFEPHKITIIDSPTRIKQALQLLKPWRNSCEVIHDSASGLEIVASGVSKGSALAYLCDSFKIPLSSVMAFGNEGNDIEMIRLAGIGVAMANSYERLKEVADIVTTSNDESGVAAILNTYILQPSVNGESGEK